MVVFLLQVRDYIHVVDLADGHISALKKLEDSEIGKVFLKQIDLIIWLMYTSSAV